MEAAPSALLAAVAVVVAVADVRIVSLPRVAGVVKRVKAPQWCRWLAGRPRLGLVKTLAGFAGAEFLHQLWAR
jgi:hypothetical protein